MKALEKDRTRRYETASDFAKDIQRYLDDEPVEACPPSTSYRLGKFVRRNKTAHHGRGDGAADAACWELAARRGKPCEPLKSKGVPRPLRPTRNSNARRRSGSVTRRDSQRERAERQQQIAQENFERARDAVDEYLTRSQRGRAAEHPWPAATAQGSAGVGVGILQGVHRRARQ